MAEKEDEDGPVTAYDAAVAARPQGGLQAAITQAAAIRDAAGDTWLGDLEPGLIFPDDDGRFDFGFEFGRAEIGVYIAGDVFFNFEGEAEVGAAEVIYFSHNRNLEGLIEGNFNTGS